MVKVCGMREAANIRAIQLSRPDMLGFIFYQQSSRFFAGLVDNLNPEGADLSHIVADDVKKVGVFVGAEPDQIAALSQRYSLDFAQLHGGEKVETCQQVKALGLGIIKVFSIDEKFDFADTIAFADVSDFYLFDTASKNYGGSGKRFVWESLNHYKGHTPFLLSGGIGPDHVDEILALRHPMLAGVDLNSQFELSPGVKNPVHIDQFIKKLRHGNKN